MIFVAFAFGLWLGTKRGVKAGISANHIMDFTVWMMVSSLIGARLAYVITHWSEYAAHPLDAISPIQSDGTIGIAGLVVLGGVIFAIPTAWYFARRRNIPFLKLTDVMMPSLAFGLAIGRIGCFLNGCCFGLPTELPWGVEFPTTCLAGSQFPHDHIHPTQVYDFLYNAVIGLILIYWTQRKKRDGDLFALFLALYGFGRFWVENFRFYPESGRLFDVSGLQITGSGLVSLAMCAAGIYLLSRTPASAGKNARR